MITYDCHIAGSDGGTFFRISTRNYHRLRCVQKHALDNTGGNTIRARGSYFWRERVRTREIYFPSRHSLLLDVKRSLDMRCDCFR